MTIRLIGPLLCGAAFVALTTIGALAENYTVTATGRIGYLNKAPTPSSTRGRVHGAGGSGQSPASLQIKNIPTGPGDDIKADSGLKTSKKSGTPTKNRQVIQGHPDSKVGGSRYSR